MPVSSHSPPGWRMATMTHLRVSAPVTSRPRPASSELAHSTSASMVVASGVSWTTASGLPSMGSAGGAGVITASTLAA